MTDASPVGVVSVPVVGVPVVSVPVASVPVASVPGGVLTRRGAVAPFEVHLDVFQGPFDLLLGLISKHKLDITEIALAQVTDEFIGTIRAAQATSTEWDLGQASEFLLIAATLLDLKASRLLPQTGPQDEEDLALIEARDLLFARLLQYRAFKDIAHTFADRMATAARMTPRQAGLEPQFAALLPELVMGITPEQLAMVAARAMTPRLPPSVGLEHLHAPQVSVREQAVIIVDRLRQTRASSFRALVADADSTLVIVARFLALLELFKEGAVALDQPESLGELTVRWTGADDGDVGVSDEFDEFDELDEFDKLVELGELGPETTPIDTPTNTRTENRHDDARVLATGEDR
ncbi:MAG: ScpA family protein [Lapillicoccus sp.]